MRARYREHWLARIATIALLVVLSTVGLPDRVVAQGVSGTTIASTRQVVVEFSDIASADTQARAHQTPPADAPQMPIPQNQPVPSEVAARAEELVTTAPEPEPVPGPLLPSPPSSSSFLALEDNNTKIPPDTNGAVGPTHLMVTLNSQVRIQNRAGGTISTVSLLSFWSPIYGGSDVFDPKVIYDPFNGRWIVVSCADRRSASSAILIAVSASSDPTGAWIMRSVDADSGNIVWADFPSLGFNKDWIVVQLNMFNISGDAFNRSHVYIFDKMNLYANGANPVQLVSLASACGGTCGATQSPAITYDNTLATEYLLQNWNSNSGGTGYLRIYTITGPIGSATVTPGSFATTANPWDGSGPVSGGEQLDFAPQLGIANKIQTNDSRMHRPVYRNGSLWAAHTVFLPAGGATRSSIQWWQINPAFGSVTQRARIDDATGAQFFAFPTIAVNANSDVLIGYSRYSSSQFASANYAFRTSGDPPNTLRDDTVLKVGEAAYYKIFSGTKNRWGDYSNTVVDPVNDTDMWTIQEYAAAPISGSSRWGTWWGRIIPPLCGNNVIEPGEACDGSSSGACTNGCYSDCTCKVCGPVPESNCFLQEPGKASVAITDEADDTRDKLRWKWKKGEATSTSDFGNPLVDGSTPSYSLCLYDSSVDPQPLMQSRVVAGGFCGAPPKPCWKPTHTGFAYANRDGGSTGVTKMTLAAGATGRSQVRVQGKGVALGPPNPQLTLPVTVQLLIDDGVAIKCWQTTFSTFTENSDETFKAKGP